MLKSVSILLTILLLPVVSSAADPAWTWLNGTSETISANYGAKGIPSATNTPGSTVYASTWTDSGKNLWLYGGMGSALAAQSGTLWKFQTDNNIWTWVNGEQNSMEPNHGTINVAAASNNPGSRSRSTSWTGLDGKFWLFGGSNWHMEDMADLWCYDPSIDKWTWVSGSDTSEAIGYKGTSGETSPENYPAARYGASGWVDTSGDLWLFGGIRSKGPEPYIFNDLWKFDIASHQWAWMKGDNITTQGVFGNPGVPAPSNIPPAVQSAMNWTDVDGNLWLFGGGLNLKDSLWRFTRADNNWTWMGGSQLLNQTVVYGIKNVEALANRPGGRMNAAVCKATNSDIWLYGGLGRVPDAGQMRMADLWKLNPTNQQWTWIGGSDEGKADPIYPPDADANPGSRMGSATWQTSDGRFYLFGGFGANGGLDIHSDMWTITPVSTTPAAAANWSQL